MTVEVSTPSAATPAGIAEGTASSLSDAAPAVLQLRCFGGFDLRIDGSPVNFRGLRPRARMLLKFLALHAGRRVHRDTIIEALWGDLDTEAGIRNFHVNLSGLRGALEPGVPGRLNRLVRRDGETYELHLGADSHCDLSAFHEAFDAARAALRDGDEEAARTAYGRVLDIYAGELLPEAGAAEWVLPARSLFANRAAESAAHLAELELAADRPMAAAETAQRCIDIDHYRDDAWRCLVRALRLADEPAAAERALRGYREVLAELGVEAELSDL